MEEKIEFFTVKDPKKNIITNLGFKTYHSAGRLIVYCTEDGPLDSQFYQRWLQWRKEKEK